ncbi:MAG: hypothetical protein ACHQNV_00515 [Vicinamibacteria bacterium]
MFESGEKLARDVGEALAVLRRLGSGRYACLLERDGIVLEDPDPGETGPAEASLRALLVARSRAIFGIPESLAADAPMEDVLGDSKEDEFLIAILNGKVALVVACPDAEALRDAGEKPLSVLADSLFRWKPAYRLDPQGRGLFVSGPRLDVVVVGRAAP